MVEIMRHDSLPDRGNEVREVRVRNFKPGKD